MPNIAERKDHPLSMRLPAADIAMIDRAASLRGRSRTDFVRDAAVREAEDVIMQSMPIRMSAEGFSVFMEALAQPGRPVPKWLRPCVGPPLGKQKPAATDPWFSPLPNRSQRITRFRAFSCGKPVLDHWLQNRALSNQNKGFTAVMVVHEAGRVVGFYGLAPTAIVPAAMPRSIRTGQPPDPVPCLLLGQLATDISWRVVASARGCSNMH